jgi:hypothetical protein
MDKRRKRGWVEEFIMGVTFPVNLHDWTARRGAGLRSTQQSEAQRFGMCAGRMCDGGDR